jgi:hypothetical protein
MSYEGMGHRGYGNDHRNVHEITSSIEHHGLANQSQIDRAYQSTQSAIIGGDRDIVTKVTEGDKDLLAAINREAGFNAANINSQAQYAALGAHSDRVETRQAIERNADNTTTQATAQSIAELLAIENTATATQLGVQTTATATQLGVQNTATAITNAIRDSNFSTASTLSALSIQAERINGLNVVESKNIQVNQGRDLGASNLLAAQNFSTLQLQASESKGYLTNHITATSSEGILKTVEGMNKVMEKLAECCCENKLLHKDTQQLIATNETNALRAAVTQAQQDLLLSKLSSGRGGGS